MPLLKVEAGNYEKSHSANQRRYRRFSPDSFSGVSDYGNRGARAVIYAVTVAAVGIDLTQPLSETTDRRRNAARQN